MFTLYESELALLTRNVSDRSLLFTYVSQCFDSICVLERVLVYRIALGLLIYKFMKKTDFYVLAHRVEILDLQEIVEDALQAWNEKEQIQIPPTEDEIIEVRILTKYCTLIG